MKRCAQNPSVPTPLHRCVFHRRRRRPSSAEATDEPQLLRVWLLSSLSILADVRTRTKVNRKIIYVGTRMAVALQPILERIRLSPVEGRSANPDGGRRHARGSQHDVSMGKPNSLKLRC